MKKIILLSLCILFSCQYFFQLEPDKNLAKKIKREILVENKKVDISDLTDFNWDELITLGPYSDIKEIEKEFNLDLTNIQQNGIKYSDYYYLVVFLNNKESVKIIELDKAIGPERKIIEKTDCIFTKGQDGSIVLAE